MGRDTSKYVKTCHPCQTTKPTRKIIPKPKIFKVPETRFTHLHMDIVGPLPTSEGMNYLLTIVCRKSRWVEAIPMAQATSKSTCNAFLRGWLSRYGAPQEIFCDNGNTYTAGLWLDLNRILGITVTFVPRFHQQTNGAIERQHRSIKESLKASLVEMGDVHREHWMTQLPFTLLGRRIAYQPDLGASAADLCLGQSPLIPGVALPDHPIDIKTNELLQKLQENAAKPAVQMSRHSPPVKPYMPAETATATHVYVKLDKVNNLGQKYSGPHIIVDRPSNTTLTIKVGVDKNNFPRLLGLTATTASPMVDYGRGHSFFLKMAMVAEF